jgi:2,5-diamino-6-(ribosylamino)-4(3H)-pyrimidinone 5'-phosphate reductase
VPDVVPLDRPFVWINCAVSADGRLAYAGGRRAHLSGPADLRRVQELRANSDGIVVGIGTVLLDDPSLRVHWELLGRPPGRSPTRIVLDSRGRTPAAARILDGSQSTIVLTTESNAHVYPAHVEVLRTPGRQVDLPRAFRLLRDRGMSRLLVEGGAEVLAGVLRSGVWDRFTIYIASVLIGGASAPPMLAGPETPDPSGVVGLIRESALPLDDGVLLSYRPSPPPGPSGG